MELRPDWQFRTPEARPQAAGIHYFLHHAVLMDSSAIRWSRSTGDAGA
jgi:hypothetical protein